jgi:DsbC/DsbD-like thiol-disulfide interchange protein
LAAVAIALSAPAAALVGPWHENPHSKVRLVTPYLEAARSGTFSFGIEFTLAPGWHAYWRNSGDAGFPPVFDAKATPELGDVQTLWPTPHRFTMPGDLVSFGYADEVTYPLLATIQAPDAAALALRVAVDYLVCEVECVPYRYDLALEQPLAASAKEDPEVAPKLARWLGTVPRPVAGAAGAETWVTAQPAGGGWDLTVHLREPSAGATAFFDAHKLLAIEPAGPLAFRASAHDANAPRPTVTELSWVVGNLDARQSVELPSAGRGPSGALGWPVAAAGLVVVAAVVIIFLGRKGS